jgi:hypothetical protein
VNTMLMPPIRQSSDVSRKKLIAIVAIVAIVAITYRRRGESDEDAE